VTDPHEEELLEELQPAAFAIAYRMLGSVAEAEDVVQESLLRVHDALEHGQRIESPRAYVATIATRLAIDQLRSARARRETYVGDWLPEPIVTERPDDPARQAEMADSLSLAFLVLLESLSPEQRAVLLLHDVFDYGYGEIADIVGKTEANTRQLAVRARRHVEEGRPRFDASREEQDELAQRFFAAAQDGDLGALEEMLAHDVVLQGDGGGKAPALARALHGRSRVARTLAAWGRQGARLPGLAFHAATVNGQPGAVVRDGEGNVISVMALEMAEGQIQGIRSIVNPDKLRHLGPVANVRELLKRRATSGPESPTGPETPE
jgi:RNA polymerase sigma-70 factor (ECF subfamily)